MENFVAHPNNITGPLSIACSKKSYRQRINVDWPMNKFRSSTDRLKECEMRYLSSSTVFRSILI